MSAPSEEQLSKAIADAARTAITQLFAEYPSDNFYYCSLVTTGEGHTPCLTAWSKEKLDEAVRAEGGNAMLALQLKWSYADSPFYAYGEHFFDTVKRLLVARSGRTGIDSTTDGIEVATRLRAMESAMAQLDSEGLFGTGRARLKIVVNAEVMPPDSSNGERAARLNPPGALANWLNEAVETGVRPD